MKGIQLADYDLSVEVVRDNTGKIVSGMVIGDVLEQNQAIILNMHKGELKENPYMGAGVSDMLLDYHRWPGEQRSGNSWRWTARWLIRSKSHPPAWR